MARKVLRIERPFTGGMVTDLPPDQLDPRQSPYLENVVFVDGVATERGGWSHVGTADPLAASIEGLAAVKAVRFQGDADDDLMVSSEDCLAGIATAGEAGTIFDGGSVLYYPRAVYRGEVIWCAQDRLSSIRRTVKCTSTTTAGTGTFAVVEGENRIVGTGTNFDPHVPIGSYINRGLYRVVTRTSDTSLTIATTPDQALSGWSVDPNRWGYIGLLTEVTRQGAISHVASSATLTGTGTTWLSDGPGFGASAFNDWVMTDTAQMRIASTPVSDTSLTVDPNSVGDLTAVPYVMARPACGSEACVHRNRLWIAGVEWAPNRLYLTPEGHDLGHLYNGAYSKLTETADSRMLHSVDVPAPDAAGRIVALTSGPDGLYVHKTDSLYRVTGEWPALNVQKVADYGTVEIRAAISTDDGIFFAGPEGIFAVRGNSLDNLVEKKGNRGGRLAEWIERMRLSSRCVLGVVRGHLFISTGEAPPECWKFDLRGDRWCGNVTSEDGASTGPEHAIYFDSAKDVIIDSATEDVGTDRLFMVTGSTTTIQVGDLTTVIPANPGGGVEVDSEGLGRFRADTPTNIAGSTGQLKRVIGAKVGYVLAGDNTMTIDVTSNVDEADTSTDEVSLPEGDGYDLEHVRIPASSGGIGKLGRLFKMSFQRSANPTSASRVAVHDIELVVGERRPRA